MKALAWLSLVVALLVGADGIYMVSTHYQPKDVNNFHLSDGGTVIVAAAILLLVTVVAFIAANRSNKSKTSVQSTTGRKESR